MPTVRARAASVPASPSGPKKSSAPPAAPPAPASTSWAPRPKTARPQAAVAVAGPAKVAAVRAGPVSELEPMSAIVVANPDGFGATGLLHQQLAKALPKGAKLVVLHNKDFDEAWFGKPPAGALTVTTTADSPWARDFAPTFVRTKEGKLEAVEFKYLYPGSDGIAKEMAKKLKVPVRSSPIALEGGNLLADKGRLFVTTKLLARNPGMTQAQLEAELKSALHLDAVEWMTPLPDEPTGHVDMYAKLVAPNTMLVSDTPNPKQKAVMDQAAKRFEALGYTVLRATNAATKPHGTPPGWGPTRSYANALVVNGTAFVPQYLSNLDQQQGEGKRIAALDAQALAAYAKAGLKVVGVPADDLIQNQGSVHCMTNTLPAELDPTRLR